MVQAYITTDELIFHNGSKLMKNSKLIHSKNICPITLFSLSDDYQ